MPTNTRRRFVIAATSLSAVVLCLVVLSVARSASRHMSISGEALDDELSNLASTVEYSRAGDARFSGFPYRPVVAPVRAGSAQGALSADTRLVLARLEKEVGADRSAKALHRLGVAFAIEGRLDDSVNSLSESTAQESGDATAWTDLSAAYLARGRPDDLSGASDAAQRALRLMPANGAARFNRALALERLHLDGEAAAEWASYLLTDIESGWAVEAKSHVRQLSVQREQHDWKRDEIVLREALHRHDAGAIARIVATFPQQARELVSDSLLPEWAKGPHPPTEDFSESLQESLALSQSVADRGDRLMLDAVRSIIRAPRAEALALAQGHQAFAQGRAASGEYRYADADVSLADAERLLNGRSPVAAWATMLRAVILFQRNDLAQAQAKLLALRSSLAEEPYPALLGQVDWAVGVVSAAQGDFTGAFDSYRRALAAFEQVGEVENIATVQSLLAETTRVLGDPKGSWALELEALSHLAEIRRPQRKQVVVLMAGLAALRQGRPSVALDFQNRFFEASKETGSQAAIAEALLNRARVYRQLGDLPQARNDLTEALLALRSATSLGSGVAGFLTAQIDLEDALTSEGDDGARALERLDAALSFFRSSHAPWLPRAYLARARLLMRQGSRVQAEADLRAGIETLESQRKTVSSETLRVSYLDETWDLFDEMIALQLELGREREAFAFAERSRALSLLDSIGNSVSVAFNPTQVAEAMPPDAVMLYFVLVRNHAVVWVLGRNIEQYITLTAAPDVIDRHARDYRREYEARHDAAATAAGVVLYKDLIQPVASWLRRDTTIVIAPDRALHQVPFAALREAPGGDVLVKQHPLVVAPSARLFFRPAQSNSRARRATTALVIGNPSSDRSLDLPYLAGAEQEATDIAALYPGAVRLVRGEATRSRFLEAAPAASVVHIAAHAIANEEFPDLSRFFLAQEGATSGIVTVSDLGRLTLPRTELVVLAACGTASGMTFRGEGVTSLARPFLARGAAQVLGTLWEVDDQTSRRLFTAFHKLYAQGVPAATALQRAQLQFISADASSSTSWAATVLLGSVESVARTPENVGRPPNGDSSSTAVWR